MSSAADRPNGRVDPDALLVDVSETSFAAILQSARDAAESDSALGRAVRRVEAETNSDEKICAGFGNFAPDDPGPDEQPERNRPADR